MTWTLEPNGTLTWVGGPANDFADTGLREVEDLRARFKLTCRKCGSENVAVDFENGIDYGDLTGYQPGSLSIGCNTCKQNDYYLSL